MALGAPAGSQDDTQSIISRMAAANGSLQSYKVRVHFDVDLHSFITMHPGLDATYYFKKPDKAELDFDTVPILAQEFQHFYASLPAPSTWQRLYDVSVVSKTQSGGHWRDTLKLVPKHGGNVDRMLVAVDEDGYAIVRQEWYYRNGGTIVMDQQNQRLGAYILPKRQSADFKLPSYQAHVISAFGRYELNVPIADSVFTH